MVTAKDKLRTCSARASTVDRARHRFSSEKADKANMTENGIADVL